MPFSLMDTHTIAALLLAFMYFVEYICQLVINKIQLMKRYLMYAVIIAAFSFATAACKKQTVQEEPIVTTDTVPGDPTIYPDPVLSSRGLLVGKVMPETKFSVLLYNDDHSYTEYSILNRTGAFMMKDVEAGNYTLLIQPADPNLNPVELIKITVDSSRTTNLGLIFLP